MTVYLFGLNNLKSFVRPAFKVGCNIDSMLLECHLKYTLCRRNFPGYKPFSWLAFFSTYYTRSELFIRFIYFIIILRLSSISLKAMMAYEQSGKM